MRWESRTLVVPAGTGPGAALRVDDFINKCVQLVDSGGNFSGSLDIEGSLDGSNWSPVIQGVTTATLLNVTASVLYLRANKTAQTAGALTGLVGGFNVRTDGG